VFQKRIISMLIVLVMLFSLTTVSALSADAASYKNTYKNTGNQRVDIVEVAKTQIGYKEGSNNDTKYGDWYGMPHAPWCAMFVSWCARQAGVPTSVIRNSAVASARSYSFNLKYRNGYSYTPKPGDIFFAKDWSHVGIVASVKGDYFYSVEGNSNKNGSNEGVAVVSLRRRIANNYFGVPKYINNSKYKVDTKFPTFIKAQTLSTKTTKVYSAPKGKALSNKISGNTQCTIQTIYTNGWCNVTFPLKTGGYESGYVKTSAFLKPTYDIFKVKTSKALTLYSRRNLKSSLGNLAKGKSMYIIGHTSSAVQLIYSPKSGEYKIAWAPISKFVYNIKYKPNGGSGSMKSSTVKYRKAFKLASNKFTKTGYTFAGWNSYRSSDKTWHVKGVGWNTSSKISSKKYTKHLYKNGASYSLKKAWMSGGTTNDTLTFYAKWKVNNLDVCYNANGGNIESESYKLYDGLVYNTDDSVYTQTFSYNKATGGLISDEALGLTKDGYTFSGWSTQADGGTIFSHNDTELLPTAINNNIKKSSCTSTLFAVWEPNTLNINYNANGGTITSGNYVLADDYIINSDNSKLTTVLKYNEASSDILCDVSAFGLSKEGFTFLGWSTSPDGEAIITEGTTTLTAKDITTAINHSNCTVDLYAVWKAEETVKPTQAQE